VLLLQVLCRMKKLIGRVKRVFSSGPSSRGSGSRSGDGSQDSAWSSSFMPSPHETRGSIRYLAHDDIPMATDGNDISIRSTEEMEKYESLHQQEFGHTHVYDVNLLEREDWNGRRASPHPPNYWLGKTLRRGLGDSSDGWMTLHICKQRCKPPSTPRPA
jgi:hypothetical protein